MYEFNTKDFKDIREIEADMTQDAFAEALGVTVDTIRRIESGRSFPSIRLLFKIIRLFNVHIDFNPNSEHPLLKQDTPAAE